MVLELKGPKFEPWLRNLPLIQLNISRVGFTNKLKKELLFFYLFNKKTIKTSEICSSFQEFKYIS